MHYDVKGRRSAKVVEVLEFTVVLERAEAGDLDDRSVRALVNAGIRESGLTIERIVGIGRKKNSWAIQVVVFQRIE